MACVDPHLISGADIIVDVDAAALSALEKVQKTYLRRILGLGTSSICAPLFTEMGLLPVRYRRLILAIRYVNYVVGLEKTHYAWLALADSFDLFQNDCEGYWMDLIYALESLPFPVTVPNAQMFTAKTCESLCKQIYFSAMTSLEAAIIGSTRLYLLHGRDEPVEEGSARPITAILRHYLKLVVNADHRRALTRLLLSQHGLAIESLRYNSRYYWRVERHLRLCRFGCDDVETVEHALFFCGGSENLADVRHKFVHAVSAKAPSVLTLQNEENATVVLKKIIFNKETVCRIAKFASQTFRIFSTRPLRRPASSRRPML
ncbi:hypothetical protein C8J57DRAFT_1104651 [Mycena rebaudengoi]|nr:hypothetical protein C8J57DRAFT_1104651 [Mycena rebaudengoi]